MSVDGGNCSGRASEFTGLTSMKTFRSMGFFKVGHQAKAWHRSNSGGLLGSVRPTRRNHRAAHDTRPSRGGHDARLAAGLEDHAAIPLNFTVHAFAEPLGDASHLVEHSATHCRPRHSRRRQSPFQRGAPVSTGLRSLPSILISSRTPGGRSTGLPVRLCTEGCLEPELI